MKSNIIEKSLISIAVAACLQTHAVAQEEDIEHIGVTFRSSLAEAALMKKQETKVADIISAEDIGKFPTENIAEAIQRIPGVQISNLNGRGSTISVRGLGSQYARTTVNGQTLASADFTSGFRFDIIQSEVASAIEVIKSPSADMDSGGLSGTINIGTAKPLSFDEQKLVISAKGQYSEQSPTEDVTPKGTITYIDQFADDTIGVFLNAGYQSLDDRVDVFWNGRWLEDDNGNIYPKMPRYRRIDRETDRYLLNGAVQWRPSSNFETQLTAMFVKDDTDQDLIQQVYGFDWIDSNSLQPTGEPVDGAYPSVTLDTFTITNSRQQEIHEATSEAITLETEYVLNNWIFSGVAHHTKGTLDQSEAAVIIDSTVDGGYLNYSDPNNVILEVENDMTSPSQYRLSNLSRNGFPNGAVRNMTSQEDAVQFDAERLFDGMISSMELGVKYRREKLDRKIYRVDRITIGEADWNDLPSFENSGEMITGFLDNKMSIPHTWLAPDINAYKQALKEEGVTIPVLFSPQSSYEITRDITSAYAKINFETDIYGFYLRGDTGFRYEQTSRNISTYLTGESDPRNGDVKIAIGTSESDYDYSNFLPSLNAVLELTDELQARFSAAKVLVRPLLTSRTQIAPSQVTSDNAYGTKTFAIDLGQPNLEALTADQIDLGLEWYYGEGNSLTGVVFWKDIKNGSFSEYTCPTSYEGTALTLTAGDCRSANGDIYEIRTTLNDSSKLPIKGFELGWNQSLDTFLPINGFGVSMNYTFIDAEPSEGYSLTNSSEKTWNIIGYWENEDFSARLMLNHRSDYLQDSSDSFFAREGRLVNGRNQIDMLLSYNYTDNLNFRFGALNLNRDGDDALYSREVPAWQTTTVIGRSYYLSALYSF